MVLRLLIGFRLFFKYVRVFYQQKLALWSISSQNNHFCAKNTTVRLFIRKKSSFGRVFSTGKLFLIRVPQYWIKGLKGGCKGLEYSKTLKIPLSSSTGMGSDTLIYHNACNSFLNCYTCFGTHQKSLFG